MEEGDAQTTIDETSRRKNKRICLTGQLAQESEIYRAALTFGLPVVTSETGVEISDEGSYVTVFVLNDFEAVTFEDLQKPPNKVLGPVALRQLSENNRHIPQNSRPLYNLAMDGTILCFTGFRKKQHLVKLVNLVHYMSGSIRREMSANVTHLVADSCFGDKYRYATTFKVPVMHESWVISSWKQRKDRNFCARAENFVAKHKLKPFHGTRVCFIGISSDETMHMQEVLEANGGQVTDLNDPSCTHVVSDFLRRYSGLEKSALPQQASQKRKRHSESELNLSGKRRCSLVDTKFSPRVTKTIGYDTCTEINETVSSLHSSLRKYSKVLTDEEKNVCKMDLRKSFSKDNIITKSGNVVASVVAEKPALQKAFMVKPLWFWASVQNVACEDENDYLLPYSLLTCNIPNDCNIGKRTLFRDSTEYSLGSILDYTGTPERIGSDQAEVPAEKPSARKQVFLELVQTESNYVRILETIIKIFKEPLESVPEKEALLNSTELKMIFGNLPPILDIHKRMFEQLQQASINWTENTSIGKILKSFSMDFLKAYTPFVNFFEAMKDMVLKCDQNKPRFHAFLKICELKPECARQSLQDLLIRPVQRLPSISLLLNDILKHTDSSNRDYQALKESLSVIKEVMMHINENKRKTEGQVAIFEIFNEIENCPADVVSSHRSFISRCEAMEVITNELNCRGCILVLFLFTDQLEICKKRSRRLTLISPNTPNGSQWMKNAYKPYKHVSIISLNTVKRIIDIQETPECQKCFALVIRDREELKDKLYSFAITQELDKTTFLKILCKNVANASCCTDSDELLVFMHPEKLDIDTGELNSSKIYKSTKKTQRKVGRVFSFKKTPSSHRQTT